MGKVKKGEFWQSVTLNNTSMQYYNTLNELTISMFEWKNLPKTLDPRFLETEALNTGFGRIPLRNIKSKHR